MVRYKFILKHLSAGSLEISEPLGWNEASFKLDREKTHDVLFEYSTQLGFYGKSGSFNGGRDFIQNIVDLYGVDTLLELDLFVSAGSREPFEFENTWAVNLEDYELTDDPDQGLILNANIHQKGFQVAFQKRYDSKVNFKATTSLDGGQMLAYTPHQLTMHSKQINKKFVGEFEFDSIYHGGVVSNSPETRLLSVTIGWPVVTDEIDDVFTLGSGFLTNQQRVNFFEAKEEGDFTVNVDMNARLKIDRITGDFDIVKWQWILQKNEEPATIINQRIDTEASGYEEELSCIHSEVISLSLGDRLYLYGNVEISDIHSNILGQYHFDPWIKFLGGSSITMSANTSIPDNQINCQLIHNAFAKVCDAITGVKNSFYSEYLGHTQIQQRSYAGNGEFSFFALASGAELRNLTDRELSVSFKELFESLSAITPVGIGLDTINGQQVIRLEHISHFYDSESVLTLNLIEGMRTTVAKDYYYKTIEVGYTKGLPEDIGGLNEPNVKKEYSTVLKNVGKKGSFVSNFIASSSLIEQQRREAADSKDARYDNSIFIIALNRSDLSIAEKDENYSAVVNLDNPSSIYNLRLSPAMNLLRQGPIINVGLTKKVGSVFKLLTNEGNFNMQTTASHTDSGNFNQLTLDESADIKWNYAELPEVKPLFKPFIKEFTHPLSFTDFKILRDVSGRRKAITISTDGEVFYKAHILTLEYNQDEGTATFKTIEANEIPVEVIDENIGFLQLVRGGYLTYEQGGNIILN